MFGLVVEALSRRRDQGGIADDHVLRQHRGQWRRGAEDVPQLCRVRASWLRLDLAETRFPNSMVDRITPATTPEVTEALSSVSVSTTSGPSSPTVHLVGARGTTSRQPSPFEDVDVLLVDDVDPTN